jgi:SAM-dependent methyltransferase
MSNKNSKYLETIYNNEYTPITSYPSKLALRLFTKYNFISDQRLLEVGCGRGEMLREFKNLGLICTGIDRDTFYENELIAYGIEFRAFNLSENPFPYEDNSFDIIYTKSFVEHINNPEFFLNECKRVLKPNGKILNLVPDWEANMQIFFDDHTHIRPYTTKSLNDLYRMIGFNDISVNTFRQLPIVWKFPFLNFLCKFIAIFVPHRSKIKFFRWSKELMIEAFATK